MVVLEGWILNMLEGLGLTLARMAAAYMLSLTTALALGILMGTSRKAEAVLNPVIDVLQSIPILGFFPAALLILVRLLPGEAGAELASVFLIFTSMVWNMIYGVYSSVKAIDPGVADMTRIYRIPALLKILKIYVPAAREALAANSAISWAGGWFFITSAEIISTGSEEIRLRGIGSFILEASSRGDAWAVGAGAASLLVVVVLGYLLIWNPMLSLRGEVFTLSLPSLRRPYGAAKRGFQPLLSRVSAFFELIAIRARIPGRAVGILVAGALAALLIISLAPYAGSLGDLPRSIPRVGVLLTSALEGILISFLRIALVLGLCLAVSVLIAWEHVRRPLLVSRAAFLGEILASFPAILWWPLLLGGVEKGLSPYVVLFLVLFQGSFWYLFYNILFYGIVSFKAQLLELSEVYGIRGGLFASKILLPSIYPSIASGLISASGGAWNATIVAEYFSTGSSTIDLGGIGALISSSADRGDLEALVVYTLILTIFVVTINKLVWSRILFKKLGKRYIVEQV